MSEQPQAVIETPKRKIRLPLPTRTTFAKVGALTGAFLLGGLVAKKRLADACACESDTTEQPSTTDS